MSKFAGVLAPVITPFREDLSPDADRFVRHCKWLLAHGCCGLAVFGTNSEANSMSVQEKIDLLQALVQGGVPAEKLMPGTGCFALTDSIQLTQAAVKAGCGGVLMLPPFYYKGVSDDGLFRNFAEVIDRTADGRLRLYLYHIPQVSNVPITLNLIDMLLTRYPGIVAGIKDSTGDWNNAKAMLDRFTPRGFDVIVGTEVLLLQNMRHGGKGCITATANVCPGPIDQLYRNWQSADADAQQAAINATRAIVQKAPMIPALKAIVAHWANDPAWKTVRPPLAALTDVQESQLIAEFKAAGNTLPGLG